MNTREKIQKQADEAEKKALEIVNAKQGDQPAKAEPVAAPVNEPVVEPAKPAEPVVPATTKTDDDPNSETWKHKFETLQGIFKAQVKKDVDTAVSAVQGQLSSYQAQVQALQAQVQSLTASKPTDPKASKPGATKVATDEFVKEWGGVGEGIGAVEDKADKALKAAESVQAETAELKWERCLSKLTAQVPDWEAINSSEEFKAYCGEVDPVFGVPRQQALERAEAYMDSAKLASFFNAFKASKTAPAGAEPIPPPVRPKADVSPATSRTSGPAPKTGKVWKESEVAKFYDDATKRKMWSTNPAEYKRIDDEINTARAEKRVVPG